MASSVTTDTTSLNTKLPFVIFTVKDCLYAVASENVQELVLMPPATRVPTAPPEIRGLINLRGNIIPVFDLRVKLGLPSIRTESEALVQMLHEREDHLNWLRELEACVRERRAFGMARDPHKCKFGLWYDQFKTDRKTVRASLHLWTTLQRMDGPHQTIHATAAEVLRKAEEGDAKGALALIEARRDKELAELIKLFAELRQILVEDSREVVIVLCFGSRRLALSVDMAEAVEQIPAENTEPPPAIAGPSDNACQFRVAKRVRTNEMILLPDSGFFCSCAAPS
ncbi:MAG TPA: chemotaxis protein CheW [Verrucomicrobiae bacterium]|nr:chemotaxis protein CheW [Verrucomicrobiae bacterium]